MIKKASFSLYFLYIPVYAFASRYSSPGEAFVAGILQFLLLMGIFWIGGLMFGKKKKNTANIPLRKSSPVSEQLTDWQKYCAKHPYTHHEIVSAYGKTIETKTELDIKEINISLKTISDGLHCSINDVRDTFLTYYKAKFKDEESECVINELKKKSENEAQMLGVKQENTPSQIMIYWINPLM